MISEVTGATTCEEIAIFCHSFLLYFFNADFGKLGRKMICGARSIEEVYERTKSELLWAVNVM